MNSRLVAALFALSLVTLAQANPNADPGAPAPLPGMPASVETAQLETGADCVTLPAGAVAWWRGESNTVDTVGINDGFGDSVNPGFGPGKVGAGFVLNSVPTRIASGLQVLPSDELDVGGGVGVTIEGWIRPIKVTGSQPILEWTTGPSNSPGPAPLIGLALGLAGANLEARLTDTNAPAVRSARLASPLTIPAGAWRHVALTFDRAGGGLSLYLNGLPAGATNLGAFRPATSLPVYIGGTAGSRLIISDGSVFVGGIDELTVYNRALSPAEIQSIAQAIPGKCVPPPRGPVPPPEGIVGWWRGESNKVDSVDAHHGTGPAGAYVNGVVGKAFLFTSSITIPQSPDLNLGLGPGLTIEAWIRPSSAITFWPSYAPKQIVVWGPVGAPAGVSLGFSLFGSPTNYPYPIGGRDPVWTFTLPKIGGGSYVVFSPTNFAVESEWQHVAATYEKASGQAALFVQGREVTRANLGSFTPVTTGSLTFPGLAITVPGWQLPDGLDEVSVYSRALTAAEIRELMLARSAGKTTEPPQITAQPRDERANLGSDVTFSVLAAGNPILKYQWRKTEVAIPGATRSSLLLTNLQLSDAGVYSVRITNAFGAVTSSNAVLRVNRAPIADASATESTAIAPSGCDAVVILDGSRSSDPDGDPLQYTWLLEGQASPLATGMVAVVRLAPGVYPVTLVVDDGLASSRQTISIEVLSLAQGVQRLIDVVNSQAARPEPLAATLSAALDSIARESILSAVNQLRAFQYQVRAQVPPEDAGLAQSLIGQAQRLIVLLSGGCSNERPAARIAKVARESDGKLRVRIDAPAGVPCILQASTDLVHWENVGVARELAEGDVLAEDCGKATASARFYRLVLP